MITEKQEHFSVICYYDHEYDSKYDSKYEASLKNKYLKDELYVHLNLKNIPGVDTWCIDDVIVGTDPETASRNKLAKANIIIFLVTASLLSSEKYPALINEARNRYEKSDIALIPVLLKACNWKNVVAFKNLKVLPSNEKPITSWPNHAEAFSEVASEICKVVEQFIKKHEGLCLKDEATEYVTNREYAKAEFTYQRALNIFRDDIFLKNKYIDDIKFEILKELGDFRCKCEIWNQALEAYDQALELDSKNVHLHLLKSAIFLRQKNFEKAQEACQKTILLDPQNSNYQRNLGKIFYNGGKYEEAHKAYEAALQLKPLKECYIHRDNGDALYALKLFRDARDAYERAIESYNGKDPNFLEQTRPKLEDAQNRRSRQLLRDDLIN